MKKIPIILLTLLCLTVFVSASMIQKQSGNYEVSINIQEGWNIIAGTFPQEGILASSDIQLHDIKAVWYYSPIIGEYLRVYPDPETSKLQQADDDIVLTSAMWVYSKKSGVLKYNTLEDYPPLDQRQLYAGYNFVTITPDMIGPIEISSGQFIDGKLQQLASSCELEKAFFFNPVQQSWVIFPLDEEFEESEALGLGVILKVSDDCTLGTAGTSVAQPPPIPN